MIERTTLLTRDNVHLTVLSALPEPPPRACICMLHGVGEHAGVFSEAMLQFCNAGFGAFSLSLRGHGTSDGKRGAAAPRERILEDVDLLVDYVKSLCPAPLFLAGHSMGGNIALCYRLTREAPVGYLAWSPWLRLANPPSLVFSYLEKFIPFLSHEDTHPVGIGRKLHENAGFDPLRHNKISYQTLSDVLSASKLILNRTPENHSPVLLCHGASDQVCTVSASRELARHLGADCTYVEFPNCRHELYSSPLRQTLFETSISFINRILAENPLR